MLQPWSLMAEARSYKRPGRSSLTISTRVDLADSRDVTSMMGSSLMRALLGARLQEAGNVEFLGLSGTCHGRALVTMVGPRVAGGVDSGGFWVNRQMRIGGLPAIRFCARGMGFWHGGIFGRSRVPKNEDGLTLLITASWG